MPYLTKYHLGEQHASALLGPVADTLRELERRGRHYYDRCHFTADTAPGVHDTAELTLASEAREVVGYW